MVHLCSDPVEIVAAVLSHVSRVFPSVADAEGGGEGHAEAAAHHRGPRVLRRLQPEALRHLQVLPKGAVSSLLVGGFSPRCDVSVRHKCAGSFCTVTVCLLPGCFEIDTEILE